MNYSKLFSDLNDHMETKISFCQRSSTIPATANDRNDHDRWDRIISDRNELMEATSRALAAIVTIVTIPAIIWKSQHSDRNDHDDPSDRICPAI